LGASMPLSSWRPTSALRRLVAGRNERGDR
jgi:hypothetical protein